MSRTQASSTRFEQWKVTARARRENNEDTQMDGSAVSRDRNRGILEMIGAFWRILGHHRWMMAASLAVLSVATLLALAPPYAVKIVFDSVLGDVPLPGPARSWFGGLGTRSLALAVVVAAVVLSLAAVLLGLWSRWQATRISKRVQVDARTDLFEHASRLPLHRVQELKSGGVSSLLRDDAGAIGELLFNMIYNPWKAVVQLCGSLAVLAFIDWRLLALGLAVLPLVWITHRTWISRIRPIWRSIRGTRREIDGDATETFGGMRIVRGFGRARTETNAFVRGNDYMIRQELHGWWWMRGVDTAWAVLIPLASSLLLLYGAYRILGDREAVAAGALAAGQALTIGELTIFLLYLGMLLGPISTLAATATQLQNGLAAMERVLDVMDEPREFADVAARRGDTPPAKLDRDVVLGRVELKHVGFRYPKSGKAVLSDVSLLAEPGTTTAFVGPSGAGKTTLCNLIARFYDVTSGSITLDGRDLRDVDVDSYRRLLGIVEQDVFLFDGTIRDNIAYGRRDATPQMIEAAARDANAHGFILDLEHGYDTKIGERGVKLSGGQRQRLAIARAVLADPRVLILDEATSALDTESERLIQGSLARLMEDRTSFVIAHRLSTITGADQIVVIDRGEVLERGTHAELMEAGGVYRGMIRVQLESGGVEEAALAGG
ncbi:ABC transporter ATP-binding protein [Phycisphaera mikurensis]|uniref:Putative ABC transporter permease/ATP-binding protein n=1 Tax=Phycisphaera mikurensis (strain NBRC 102666 / KCTC 22515 / FYK2301M01) TaxID=1142394 RepID=I0IE28_PHYMF|nr:ABC transporter ATP-binding protein [Phycisphaera mikurensis]MBB6441321.1 ATP-binding cassette subfamily B protein/subfamily B ATP-binding cassette protein MsbA [Phycisphaera mikurensis]BAM03516.1 putative ABC transporter permease/ATP-binding protein [Phycisphaera mikurensis NBRC 102666]